MTEANAVRFLYTFLFYLILPVILLRLLRRSLRQPAYRKRFPERFGYHPFKLEKCIWVHAVSVGEAIAAIPLIKGLQARYPQMKIVVTTMTPTGAERVQTAFGASVIHAYIPYDLPSFMQRLIKTIHPVICIIMETELWPNLLAACDKHHVPVCLVNARLSEKSARGYRLISAITRKMLAQIHLIAAHGQADAERFIALGAASDRMIVTGNIKFDIEISAEIIAKSAALRQELGDRFIWIAASTHEGEEEIILAAHQKILAVNPHALLILVPRHPARFSAMAALSEKTFATARRSLNQTCTAETAVYLGDTMGELLMLYGAADVAFVAGSLVPRGGHNMLEPSAFGKPVLTGNYLFNFAEISDLFVSARALIKVNDAEMLASQLIHLMQHPAEQKEMGARALQVISQNRGALQKQITLVSSLII